MNFEKIEALLQTSNQKFLCEAAGVRYGSQKKEIELRHEVTSGLSNSELDSYASVLCELDLLSDMLSRYSSVRLFCDTVERGSAFYIAHPNEWSELRTELTTWINALSAQERAELTPSWLDNALVFGEVPESGNYFLTPLQGKLKGTVFEFEHDGFEFVKIANDFQEFLDHICTVTAGLISTIRSHVRYFDGVSEIQWIPISYLCEGNG